MEPELDIYSELIGLIDDNFKPKEAVKIEKYLKKLLDNSVKFDALIEVGVDNWGKYDEAMEIYNEWREMA